MNEKRESKFADIQIAASRRLSDYLFRARGRRKVTGFSLVPAIPRHSVRLGAVCPYSAATRAKIEA